MEKRNKKSRLAKIPAWALSLMALGALIVLIVFLEDPKSSDLSTIQIIGYTLCVTLITAACFIICRTHPKSVWYTLVICNAVGILGLIANITLTIAISDYDTPSSELIFWGGMFILSAISAIAGSRLGKRKTIQST